MKRRSDRTSRHRRAAGPPEGGARRIRGAPRRAAGKGSPAEEAGGTYVCAPMPIFLIPQGVSAIVPLVYFGVVQGERR